MRISTVPLDSPDDAFGIVCSCQEFDQPDLPAMPLTAFAASLAAPWPGQEVEHYVGLRDGVPVGYLSLALPQRDNRTLCQVGLRVVPEHRRHGVGRALLDLAIERARALGRTHLVGTSVQIRPDGAAFAQAIGAHAALQQIRSRLDLSTADQGRLDALRADAWKHADGYQLAQWVGLPPADLIDDVAAMASRFLAEAPTGDLDVEPERLDAEALRRNYAAYVERQRDVFNTAVLRGGRVAGWTQIAGLRAEPERAWQQITLVLPEDRGHRLGLVVKLENLRLIRERRPELRFIDTLNAVVNTHMLAVNRAIGFEPAESTIEWQLTV
jgi:GNAT superfamily N-acetyltransferase